ncbi:MAG TPA: hypothetical protein VFZ22_02305 [Pyrinomonadaceae bacterium]|nr:hypothetical protein [Pyrinomonadaceae bacterium]
MRQLFAILFATLALTINLAAQEHTRPPSAPPSTTPRSNPPADTGGWVRYTSDSGHFSVLLPELPKEQTETTQSEHGPYTTHLFVVRDTINVYLVGYVDYDPSFNFNRQNELDANRDNFVKGIKATLTASRSLTLDGYQALEFSAETSDRLFRSRVYIVGRRPYQIVIGVPKDNEDPAVVNRFFNSFKVKAY